MITRRRLVGAAASVAAFAAPGVGLAQAVPAIIDEFYAPDTTADVALSPSGGRVAVLRNQPRAGGGTDSWIELIDTAQPEAPPKRVTVGAHEASGVAWANEQRLLVWIVYDVTRRGQPTEKIVRVIAMQDDGTKPVVLFGNRGESLRYIHDLGMVTDLLPDDPDYVLMAAWDALRGLPALYRVDVNTGLSTVLEYGALRTGQWISRNGATLVRLDSDRRGSSMRIMARPAPGEDYKLVRAIPVDQLREFELYGPTEKRGVFLAASRESGEDKLTLREVEISSLAMGPALHPPRNVDVEGVWLDGRGRLMATAWFEEKRVYAFADPAFGAHFAALERSFGPDASIRMLEVDEERRRYLGVASGPQQPGVYFLYDRQRRHLVELGSRAPALTPARLGKTLTMQVKTRDGASLPAYLTAPPSGAAGPLIVMPHGGPEVRDTAEFDVWTQAFAAKGWWVLRLNFRGSGGYGRAFAQAGWRRWGERMQEDVEDSVDQVIAAHGLDAARVAIVGASYGGYAALMGAVRRPDAYRAVVSMSGVSDLVELMKWELAEDETPEKHTYEFWRARIGDPKADLEALRRASPRLRAAEIKASVLLIHGTWDATVPVAQSRMMDAALRAAGKRVEYVQVRKAGHSPGTAKADRDQLLRVIGFVEQAFA